MADFVEKYGYERVSHGIYCSPDVWEDSLYILQLRCPKTIFSHDTALFLLDMTVQEPLKYSVTVKTGYNATHLRKDYIRVYSIKKELFELGRIKVKTPFGNEVAIYNPERSICDLIRNRSSIEVQIFQDAMKEIYRVLKPNGTLFAPTFLWKEEKQSKFKKRLMSIVGFKMYKEWDKKQFEEFTHEYGFSVAEMKLVNGGLAPVGVMIAYKK